MALAMAVDNLYHDLPVDRKPPSTMDTEIATTEPKMMQKTNKVANNPAKHDTVANTVQTPENPCENIFNLVPLNGEKFCDDEKFSMLSHLMEKNFENMKNLTISSC